MTTKIGIGFSQHLDPEIAAREAAFESKTNLREDKIDLAIVFFSIHYNPKNFLPILNKILSGTRLIGSSAAGIILSSSIQPKGIGVMTIASEDIKFGISTIGKVDSQDHRSAGVTFARNNILSLGNHRRQALLFLSDNSLQLSSAFLNGIQEVLGNALAVAGIGSCDNYEFIKNYQIFNDTYQQKSVIGALVGGHIIVGIGNSHGFIPLGKPRLVTQSTGNIIHTIDNKKAFSIYEEYFGKEAESIKEKRLGHIAATYPLGIMADAQNNYLIRNAIDIGSDGSIVCQGDVPTGSQIHIMISSRDSAKQAALEATQTALNHLSGQPPKIVLIFESMARLKLLGRSAFGEIQKIKEILPTNTPIFGMYGHGEIAPSPSADLASKTIIQNESITVIAIT